MTDDPQQQQISDFNQMWSELQKPMQEIKQQVANLSRQSARAEVAGAVEVVSALPSAGQKGRLLYLTTDNLIYYDNGSSWQAVADLPTRATMWHMDSIATNGYIFHSLSSYQMFATFSEQNVDGHSFSNSCVLDGGTYSLLVLVVKTAAGGRLDLEINSSSIGTIDHYAWGDTYNVIETFSGLAIAEGKVVLEGTINGKHASSSGYRSMITRMILRQATD